MKLGTFRWRLLMGWFLTLFGGLLCVSILLFCSTRLLIVALGLYSSSEDLQVNQSLPLMLIGFVLQFAAGVLWWSSGRRILAGQTWLPIAGCIVGYLCGVCGAMILWPNSF